MIDVVSILGKLLLLLHHLFSCCFIGHIDSNAPLIAPAFEWTGSNHHFQLDPLITSKIIPEKHELSHYG